MKKIVAILLFILFLTVVHIAYCDELETARDTCFLVTYADADAAAVSDTSWNVAKHWPEISKRSNRLKVKFYAYNTTSPANATFNYIFYVADRGCNAEIAASGSATVGAATLSCNPVNFDDINDVTGDPNTLWCWVDTLGTITTDWKDSDVKAQNDGGADSVASFIFDPQSGARAYCRIYDRSSATLKVWCVAYYY